MPQLPVQRLKELTSDKTQFEDSMGDSDRDVQRGRCYLGDGVDSHVIAPQVLKNTTSYLEVEFMFRAPTSLIEEGVLMSQYVPDTGRRGFRINYRTSTDGWEFFCSGNGVSFNGTISTLTNVTADTNWHIYKIIFDAGQISFYKDDVFLETLSNSQNAIFGANETFKILRYHDGDIRYIGVCAIYDVKLSDNNGLLAWYKCDEQAGAVAYDSSGNENHGTITNATLSTFHSTQDEYSFQNEVGYTEGTGALDGVFIPRDESNQEFDVLGNDLQHSGRVKYNADLVKSNCVKGDGTDDYVIFGNGDFDNKATLSIGCKFFTGDRSTYNELDTVFANGFERITIRGGTTSDTLGYHIRTDGNNAIAPYDVSSWGDDEIHSAMIVYDGSSIKLYIDGLEAASTTDNVSGLTDCPGSTYLLTSRNFTNRHSKRKVWDFVATDRVLTPEEILAWNNGTKLTGLLYDVPCSEGKGTTIYDVSGNGNHGTATNVTEATFWTTQDDYHYNLANGFSNNNNYIINSCGIKNDGTVWDDWTYVGGATYSLVDVSEEFGIPGAKAQRIQYTYTGTESDFTRLLSVTTKNDTMSSGDTIVASFYVKGNYQLTSGVSVRMPDVLFTNNALHFQERICLETLNTGSLVEITEWTKIKCYGTLSNVGSTRATITLLGLGTTDKPQSGDFVDLQFFGFQIEKVPAGVTEPSALIPTTTEYVQEGTYLPALSDGTADVYNNTITNPAGGWHNNAETLIKQQLAPALIQADSTLTFWFDATPEAKEIGYSDIVQNVNDANIIFADVSTSNQKQNILTYSTEVTEPYFFGPYDVTAYLDWQAGLLEYLKQGGKITTVRYGNNIIFIEAAQ